ncbi:mechanosensitive ion channel [Allosphingosinicella flava]|uniref:Mechanosensitive ion channel n=1 Tax=Allosphingosinicella flava TaxID=2771430 RepID=A0A7T2GHK1_9SPHN|nr:mechanosensitive ion channel family protein [Sphingosinicella flava]QPQ54005.1 mechanosensitive ion channel [Sphingosinicella flava]
MTDRSTGPAGAAEDLSAQAASLMRQASAWIADNSLGVLTAALAGTVIALALIGIRSFGARWVARNTGDVHWRSVFARTIARTSLFFIVMCAAELVAEHAATPRDLLRLINILFVISATFQVAIWARELILGAIEHRAGGSDEQSTLGSAIGIIRLLVTIGLFAIAIVVILDNLGVNVTGLVAGLGIGGIAIGLAAQGIFSDLFAALAIIFDKPFRRGDTIHFGTITGTVERIGLKTTRVRSLQGEQVVISNTKLLDERVHNYALFERRRIVMNFGLVYQTPPAMLARIGAEVKEIVEQRDGATFDRCHAYQFGASSIDYEFVFHVETADIDAAMQARQDIMIAIMRRFRELGAEFAYPTQTTFTAAPDGRLVMPYAEPRIGPEGPSKPHIVQR